MQHPPRPRAARMRQHPQPPYDFVAHTCAHHRSAAPSSPTNAVQRLLDHTRAQPLRAPVQAALRRRRAAERGHLLFRRGPGLG